MKYECFEVTVKDHIAHIVLNNPEKRNAMKISLWEDLPEAVHKLDQNGDVRVIVLSSTGPIFCAGLDISGVGGLNAGEEGVSEEHAKITAGYKFYENVKRMQDGISCLENCRVPVIAAIQGGCVGGGVDLITACDMRYGTKDSYYTIFEINIGMTADIGTYPRVMNVLPEGVVRELSYTGRKLGADEAARHGMLNDTYDTQEEMLEAVMKVAADIASKAPLAIAGCKRVITYARDHSTADTLDYIAIWNASNLNVGEMMEAMSSRQMKRPGNFAKLPPLPIINPERKQG